MLGALGAGDVATLGRGGGSLPGGPGGAGGGIAGAGGFGAAPLPGTEGGLAKGGALAIAAHRLS
jgi:hypothetical protein